MSWWQWERQTKDVVILDRQVVITLRGSKTDQMGKGQVIVLGRYSMEEICPVKAAIEYVRFRGGEEGGLLRHVCS